MVGNPKGGKILETYPHSQPSTYPRIKIKNQKSESPPLTFYTVAGKSVIVHSGGEVCSGALKVFGGKSRL